MSKYRPVDVRVWNDRKFLSLSSDARLLWMFLLTTPSALPIPGVVIGGEGAISEQLGWTLERYRERFQELLKSGLSIRCEARTIWLENALRYQPPCNPNMVKAWAKAWDDVPESQIKLDIWKAIKIACKSWSRLFDKLFREPFGVCSANGLANGSANGLRNGYTQDQEQDQEQDQDLEEATAAPPLVLASNPPKPNPDQQALTDLFFARYESAYGTKPTWDKKRAGQVARLLKKHSAAELAARMEFMFAGRAKWPPPPYTLDCFVANIDRWVDASPPASQPRIRMEEL